MAQSPQPAYISVEQLINRQLTDWQNLKADLENKGASINLLMYCQNQMMRLKLDLDKLRV